MNPSGGMRDDGGGRRSSQRAKKMAAKVVEVMVDDNTRKRAASARLESLERDNVAAVAFDEDDEEFRMQDEQAALAGVSETKKGFPVMRRKTRHSLAAASKAGGAARGPLSFQDILDKAQLQKLPPSVPSYLTAAMGPPKLASTRKLCSCCGCSAPHTCVRCGVRFCSIPCQTRHG